MRRGSAADPPASADWLRLRGRAPVVGTALKILVSAGLLALVIGRIGFGGEPFRLDAGEVRALAAVWFLQSLLPIVQAMRWRLIAATLGAKLVLHTAIANVYVGQFFNQVLPSSIGGDAVRVWKARRFMSIESALASISLDRLVALMGVPVILAVCSGRLAALLPPGALRWSLFALVAIAAGGVLMLLLADKAPLPGPIRRSRLGGILLSVPAAARRLFADPKRLLVALVLSIAIHLGVGCSLWMLARAAGAEAPLAAFLLLAPLVTMITSVPISIGGWGVREGVLVTALGLLDIAPATALAISIQFGLVMLVVGLPGGVLAMWDFSRRDPTGDALRADAPPPSARHPVDEEVVAGRRADELDELRRFDAAVADLKKLAAAQRPIDDEERRPAVKRA